jgi:hypothetical protein
LAGGSSFSGAVSAAFVCAAEIEALGDGVPVVAGVGGEM